MARRASVVDPLAAVSARVVIVDESPECREVLHTLLESRGVSSIEVSGAREGLELIRLHHPDVVVLDLDADSADDESVRDALDCEAREHDTALVVLGKARRYLKALPDGQVLAKPYHYAPLIRTIERLLAR
jgi:CheY-like chemotaxis protein